MTQPDKFFPKDAANYQALSSFAAKSQEDWESELRGKEVERWGRARLGLRGGLDDGEALPVVILRHLAKALGITAGLRTLQDITLALGEWVARVVKGLGGVVDGVLDFGTNIVTNITGNITDRTGLFVERLLSFVNYGKIHSAGSLMGTGQVGEINPELLINGSFDSGRSMPQGAGWEFDYYTDHTHNDNGLSGSGSAKMTANASIQSLLSNAVDVWETNYIEASVWVKWANKVGSGPLAMQLHVFDANDTLIDSPTLDSVSVGTSSDWVKLEGTYTVPKLIGGRIPTHVALAFVVDDKVTGGTIWWDDASLKKINPLSHKLVGGLQDAMDNIADKREARMDDFVDGLKNFNRLTKGTVGDGFIPSIGRILENGVRGMQGLPPPTDPFTHDDFLDAATAQSLVLTGNGSITNGHVTVLDKHGRKLDNQVADLQEIWTYLGEGAKAAAIAAREAVSAGINDTFERDESTLGSNWSTPWGSGNGTLRTEGHNACMPFDWPGGNSEWSARWVGAVGTTSGTDYQVVSQVLSSAAQRLLGFCGHNDLLARVSGSTHYIRFRVGGDGSWSVSKFVAGTEYIMQNTDGVLQRGLAGSIARPGPGSILTLYAGDLASTNLRRFKAVVNNTVVADFTEKTSVAGVPDSSVSSSYRGRGFGMRAEGVPFAAGWRDPGLVNYWASWDQT